MNGRVTAAMEMAGPGCFKAEHAVPVGKECVARHAAAAGYQVVLDSKGTLLWSDDDGAETPLLVILSEQAPQEYLAYLDGRHISWIVCGKDEVDLRRAVELLYSEFGVRRMTVAGGGTINGAFLDAGLLDEMSILSDMMQAAISENARVALDQAEYQKRYDDLAERYAAIKEQHDKTAAAIAEMLSAKAATQQFITTLTSLEKPLVEFSPELWGMLLDHATVYADDDIRFTFRNGVEINV